MDTTNKTPTVEEFFTRNGCFIVKSKHEIKQYADLVRKEALESVVIKEIPVAKPLSPKAQKLLDKIVADSNKFNTLWQDAPKEEQGPERRLVSGYIWNLFNGDYKHLYSYNIYKEVFEYLVKIQ